MNREKKILLGKARGLQRDYRSAFSKEMKAWNTVKERWKSEVTLWKMRGDQNVNQVKEFTDRRLVIHEIVTEHTALLASQRERQVAFEQDLLRLRDVEGESLSELASKITDEINWNMSVGLDEFRIVRMSMESAVERLSIVSEAQRRAERH